MLFFCVCRMYGSFVDGSFLHLGTFNFASIPVRWLFVFLLCKLVLAFLLSKLV